MSQDDYEREAVLEEESLALRHEIDAKWGIAASLGNFAWIALGKEDLKRAATLLAESLTLRLEIGEKGGFAWCLEKMAEIALIKGLDQARIKQPVEIRRAATLFGAAAALRTPIGSSIDLVDQPEHERQLAEVKAHLDESTFEEAWAEGWAMTMEQAAAYALKY